MGQIQSGINQLALSTIGGVVAKGVRQEQEVAKLQEKKAQEVAKLQEKEAQLEAEYKQFMQQLAPASAKEQNISLRQAYINEGNIYEYNKWLDTEKVLEAAEVMGVSEKEISNMIRQDINQMLDKQSAKYYSPVKELGKWRIVPNNSIITSDMNKAAQANDNAQYVKASKKGQKIVFKQALKSAPRRKVGGKR